MIKRLIRDFETSGAYSVEEVSKTSALYSEPTFRVRFHDGTHEIIFRMKSERATVIKRNPDGSVNESDIVELTFREYIQDFMTRLGEFKAQRS